MVCCLYEFYTGEKTESNFVKKNVKKKLKSACFFAENPTVFIYNPFKKK
jgi:hypothetical protein